MTETVYISEVGGRANNQDAFGHLKVGNFELWAVADGLGGHGSGEIAAQIAIETLLTEFGNQPSLSLFDAYFESCQSAILAHQVAHLHTVGMRTTLAFAISDGKQIKWGHSGDTRVYFMQESKIIRTLDHSIPQLLVQSGEIESHDIRIHQDRNRIVRALGNEGMLRYTLSQTYPLKAQETLIICTDGFWEYVNGLTILMDKCKHKSAQSWLDGLTNRILSRVSAGHDNYTAIAAWMD